jgi:hypothetical protein
MFLMPENKLARLLAYVSGLVNQNSCSRMNISQPRIGFSEPISPPVYAFLIPNDRPLLNRQAARP